MTWELSLLRVRSYNGEKSRVQLKDALNFSGHAEGKGSDTYSAPGANSGLLTKNVPKELADAVDN